MPELIKKREITKWDEFEGVINEIQQQHQSLEKRRGRPFQLIYRGVGKETWGLETDLERKNPQMGADEYFKNALRVKADIQIITKRNWDDVPEYEVIEKELVKHNGEWFDWFINKRPELCRYLMYLRHHGFPSPILDWTKSPYIATFFAFNGMDKDAKQVKVYAHLEGEISQGTSGGQFFTLPSDLNVHARHVVQQSCYSMCVQMLVGGGYQFVPHEPNILENGDLYEITIPVSEKIIALQKFDQMKINSYEMYGSEDSLIKTLAQRTGLL